jgi:multidrug transporter EmrE-like cation transporter
MVVGFLFLISAIVSTALGQFFYKIFVLHKKKSFFLLTIFAFIFTPLLSMLSLKYYSVDVVYMFTSLTIFLVVVLSKIFLNEPVKTHQFIGIGFIILGVVLYGI